jgi:hypothetical protein
MKMFPPAYNVTTDIARREVHFAMSGLWEEEGTPELTNALFQASQEFITKGQKFRVLGDLSDFQVQTKEVAEAMRNSQDASAKLGVEKMAIVYSSTLVKMQFRRVTEALELGLFETKGEALKWLRSQMGSAAL